eukprot:3332340-Rhodomonas_salina.2
MSNYRAALRLVSRASFLPDPWLRYPFLEDVCKGLKKWHTLRAKQKEGATCAMVTDVLDFLHSSERRYRAGGNARLADCALRNQVAIQVAFWGMRRSAEAFLKGPRTQRLCKDDVTLVPDNLARGAVRAKHEERPIFTGSHGLAVVGDRVRGEDRGHIPTLPMQADGVWDQRRGSFPLPVDQAGFRGPSVGQNISEHLHFPRVVRRRARGRDASGAVFLALTVPRGRYLGHPVWGRSAVGVRARDLVTARHSALPGR